MEFSTFHNAIGQHYLSTTRPLFSLNRISIASYLTLYQTRTGCQFLRYLKLQATCSSWQLDIRHYYCRGSRRSQLNRRFLDLALFLNKSISYPLNYNGNDHVSQTFKTAALLGTSKISRLSFSGTRLAIVSVCTSTSLAIYSQKVKFR